MAIAETEPKKSDADDTSTGGSKDSFGSGSKSPTGNKDYSGIGPTKTYGLKNIKGFAFNMPDGWDDKNIAVFIECCKEEIEEFRHPGEDENRVWRKIAKSGVEKFGSVTCFNVNSCIELAECLKAYIIKDENLTDNEAFKKLYDDVIDLIQYFPDHGESSINKNVRHRSRSKSTEKKSDIYGKAIKSVESDSFAGQKEGLQYPVSALQIDNLISIYFKQYKSLLPKPTSSTFLWSKISVNLNEKHGIKIDVKKRLALMKKNTIKEVQKESDPKIKIEKFISLANNFIDIFDDLPPRTIKRKDLIGSSLDEKICSVNSPCDASTKITDSSESAETAVVLNKSPEAEEASSASAEVSSLETSLSENSQSYKRRGKKKKGTENSLEIKTANENGKSDIEVAETETAAENEEISKRNDSQEDIVKSIREEVSYSKSENGSLYTKSFTPLEQNETVQTEALEDSEPEIESLDEHCETTDKESVEDNNRKDDPMSTEKKTIHQPASRKNQEVEVEESRRVEKVNSEANQEPNDSEQFSSSEGNEDSEAGPNTFTFENKYCLRSGRDTIKYVNPKPKRNYKRESKKRKNNSGSKRVLPQRSARAKPASYRVSEEEEASPERVVQENDTPQSSPIRNSSPDLKGFPTPQTLPPIYKLKRVYAQSLQSTIENLEKEANDDIEDPRESAKIRRITRAFDKRDESRGVSSNDSHYLESRIRQNQNPTSRENSISSQSDTDSTSKFMNAVVMLKDIKQIGSSPKESTIISVFPSPPRRGRPPLSQKRNLARIVSSSNESSSGEIKILRRRGNEEPKEVSVVYNAIRSNARENNRINIANKPSTSYGPMRSENMHEGHPRMNHPTSLKSTTQIRENVNRLEDLDASTAAIIERYKNRVEDSVQSKAIMQLLPGSQSANSSRQSTSGPVVLSSNSTSTIPSGGGMELISSPPEWFEKFVTDYRKHEMWKMHQLLKMHQELMDMENKKLVVLDKIVGSLNKEKS